MYMSPNKINPNPYVYSFSPFEDLSDKKIKWKIKEEKVLSLNEILELIEKEELKIEIKGDSTEEKIFNIFLDDEIRFGPKRYIIELRDHWLNSIRLFTRGNKTINLSILGFPFKIPVPLKTDRTLPDLGELLSLKRLVEICKVINKIYYPGARIYVVTEEIFGTFNNMEWKELNAYRNFLKKMIKKLGWEKYISLISLHRIETLSENFYDKFQDEVNKLDKLYILGDYKFLKKYKGAYDSLYHIVNTRRFNLKEKEYMDIYNKHKKLDKNEKLYNVRRLLEFYTHVMAIKYFAYLSLRDKLGFFERILPHVLTLSVSPKKFRLGIFPVNKYITKLPYHGVVVYDKKKNSFDIQYLIDLKRKPWEITKVFLEEDEEKKPFFYIKS